MRQAFRFYTLVVLITLGLIINLQNVTAADQSNLDQYDESNVHPSSIEYKYASALDTLDLNLHPGNTFNENSQSDDVSLTHCKSLVYQSLVSLPKTHADYLENLTLYFADGRRGLAGGSTMILRCSDVSDEEFMSVLVHEMGHVVDTGLYTGSSSSGESEFKDGNLAIYNDDLSLKFYKLSWENEKTLKKSAKNTDFVTGYAMTDPFEEFAETYNFYLLHGKQFRELAKYNLQLKRKYLFMKYYIFKGKEFDNDPYTQVNYLTRPYDSTVLNYDPESFLAV